MTKKTGEMGTIRLKRTNPGKGRERIEIYGFCWKTGDLGIYDQSFYALL